MARATTATIDLAALRQNLAQMRRYAPHSRVMAMVKANGYGHGLARAARALQAADAFGVAALGELEQLRQAGLHQPALLMAGPDQTDDVARARSLGADLVIHHPTQLELLAQAPPGAPLRCWLKVDSGMHRLGIAPDHVRQVHARLQALDAVADEIVLMTHFASSDEFAGSGSANSAQTQRQMDVFLAATQGLPGPRSMANSAAVLGWPQAHADWIRPGGALYGMSVVEGTSGPAYGLAPAMTLSTRLLAINPVARGEPVGYGAAWRCPEDMHVGVAAVGYGDGYPRHAPPGTPVLVNGRRARLAGRVSMDLTLIDLRDHPDARIGDPVVLWGAGLPVEEVAQAAGTIGYQLTCALAGRVQVVEQAG